MTNHSPIPLKTPNLSRAGFVSCRWGQRSKKQEYVDGWRSGCGQVSLPNSQKNPTNRPIELLVNKSRLRMDSIPRCVAVIRPAVRRRRAVETEFEDGRAGGGCMDPSIHARMPCRLPAGSRHGIPPFLANHGILVKMPWRGRAGWEESFWALSPFWMGGLDRSVERALGGKVTWLGDRQCFRGKIIGYLFESCFAQNRMSERTNERMNKRGLPSAKASSILHLGP